MSRQGLQKRPPHLAEGVGVPSSRSLNSVNCAREVSTTEMKNLIMAQTDSLVLDLVRIKLRWAGDDFSSFMLIIGGMASPFQRNLLGFGREGAHYAICGELAPGWEHIWLCANGFVPEDGLLKRFAPLRTLLFAVLSKRPLWLLAADLVFLCEEGV